MDEKPKLINKTPATFAGEMKTVAAEHPAVVAIPEVVRVTIVAVEPLVIAVVFDVENLEVAVGVRFARDAPYSHCPLIALGAVFYLASKCPSAWHQVSSFFRLFVYRLDKRYLS